jgi:exodeoxyribonuclease VII large subunit
LAQTLQTLDPESVLKRGYAVVRAEGDRVIDDANQVQVGEELQVQLAQGSLTVEVKQRSPSG